ncbi:signal peptidase I [Lentilactobacillus farraginis]|uniref:Signal peptidase I n=1 Tax=Lentilactobacillus farraginis DSM 18382 = JCM 14108 TaxID=1423743 RepID=X0QGY1_9LACO|nr:signal peptidase I [Lentilactobacillus farraginis]KRM06900.1 signal peptidase I [Lentilactobacillus farraginis DSM 18382 = JCM 14108]GAF37885.1 signal peptidase I [Lentilactobacillus farraginis DSM 18382 = JCM 14108]
MKTLKKIFSWVLPIAMGLLIGLAVRQYFVSASFIQGTSMQPNLKNAEMVGVFKTLPIQRNSVIIFDAHGEDPESHKTPDYYVKRVIGLPGDTVSSNNGTIYVNNRPLNQDYISQAQRTTGTGNWDLQSLSLHWTRDQNSTKVPQNKYFVLGDHRSVSNDSRYWGFVDKDKVQGVVKTAPFDKNADKVNDATSLLANAN